jgi:sulfide:quinone oxidoreductase
MSPSAPTNARSPAPVAARALDDAFSIGPQPAPEQLEALARAGFRAILCNRPDAEDPGQPPLADMQRAAEAAGLQFGYLPTAFSRLTAQQLADFALLMSSLPAPVFAYCRTGRRSAAFWANAQLGKMPRAEILAIARRAGHDLSDVLRDKDAVR